MKKNFSHQLTHPVFKLVQETAATTNIPAYAVGGFVRDIILKRPVKDLDVVVLGNGINFAEKVSQADGKQRKLSIFKTYGTAMFVLDGWDIEFVGARKESYQEDSRKPRVENGTLEDDQKRRDFTINAMSIGLNSHDFGELYDPFNGWQDLKDKRIVTPLDPNITFSDDPLRMLRAIRFASQLNFTIDPETLEAIGRNAHRLEIISKERIMDEVNKIILSKTPSIGFKLLFDTKLLHQFFPEMVALQGVEFIDGKGHKDNFYHTLEVLDNVAKVSADLWLRWAAIMHDIAKPPTKRFDAAAGWTFHGHEDKGSRMVPQIFRRLKLPLDAKMKFVQKLVLLHLRPIALTKDIVTDSGVRRLLFDAGDDIDALMILCKADITSKNEEKVKRYLANFDKVIEKIKTVEEKDRVRNWQPPISGEYIMETFNLSPCKEVGLIKNVIKEAILDGEIPNEFEAAKKLMLEQAKKLGITH